LSNSIGISFAKVLLRVGTLPGKNYKVEKKKKIEKVRETKQYKNLPHIRHCANHIIGGELFSTPGSSEKTG
jgi:hypothetical protein